MMGWGNDTDKIIQVDVSGEVRQRLDGINAQLDESAIHVTSYFQTGDIDYTNAIRNAYAATPDFGTLYLPAGWYQFSDTLTFDRPVHLNFIGNLEYTGTRDKNAIFLNALFDLTIKFNYIKDVAADRASFRGGWHGWTNDSYIGVCMRNLKNCDVEIKEVIDFTIGVRCMAESGKGFWYNRIKINEVINCKIHLDLCSKDSGSWMNSNYWYDTAFNYYSTSNAEFITANFDRVLVNQSLLNGNTYGGNANSFVNFKFESNDATVYGGTYTAIKLFRARGYNFHNYRNELISTKSVFCILDVSGTQSSDVDYCVKNITFNPLFVSGGANTSVQVVNTDLGTQPYSSIYSILPQQSKYMLMSEVELNKKYRFLTSNRHAIKNIFRKELASIDLTETLTEYSTADRSLVNGVNVSASFPIVFYLTNLSLGDEITIEIGISDSTQTPSTAYKAWDKSNEFCTGGLIGTTKTLSHKGYWDNTNNIEKPNESGTKDTFTVNHTDVGTVAILIYGGINSIRVFSSNRNNVIKKTNITKLEKIDGFVSNVIPTKKTDGYFKPDDIVFHYDGTNVTQYKLVFSDGTLTWNSQGEINM